MFFKIKNLLLFITFVSTTIVNAHDKESKNSFYIHFVNEKFGINNIKIKTTVDDFLEEVWNEALKIGAKDNIFEINRIAFDKLNIKSGAAKSLYEKGLRLANPSSNVPTADYDETLSSIARYRGENESDWYDQKHPLLIVFHNYALGKNQLASLQINPDSIDGNIVIFEVSSEKINGKSSQDIFYQWTSTFAPEIIQGTEKGEYVFPYERWRVALIINDKVFANPYLNMALKDKFQVGGCTFDSQEIHLLNFLTK